MAFPSAQSVNVPNGMFNDVGQNQCNIGQNIQLAASPCSNLTPAFYLASFISSTVHQAQASRGQFQALSACIQTLLNTLNEEYQSGRLPIDHTSVALENLQE